MPDLDVITESGPRRVFTLLHGAPDCTFTAGDSSTCGTGCAYTAAAAAVAARGIARWAGGRGCHYAERLWPDRLQ